MKAIKLVAVAILGATTLGVVTPAFAEETEVGKTVTNTKVEIIDNDNPENKIVELKTVPSAFNFKTNALSGKSYSIQTEDSVGEFTVFSNTSKAGWEVKSTMEDDQLTLNGDDDKATVTSLKFNGVDLDGTGNEGVSFSRIDKEATVGTGDMTKEAKDLEIKFTTNEGVRTLKVGDKLTGKISHQLYNTADVE